MRDCAEFKHEVNDSPPESTPELREVSTEGPSRPFFDPNDLQAIDDISLDYLIRTIPDTKGQKLPAEKLYNTVRFIVEAAEGSRWVQTTEGSGVQTDELPYDALLTFDTKYIEAVDLEESIEDVTLDGIYDEVDRRKPRVRELLKRINAMNFFDVNERVSVNYITTIVASKLP